MRRLLTQAGTDDSNHEEALNKTGFWGTIGAGCLVLCTSTKHFLLACRGKEMEEPLTWGVIGGALDKGESFKAGALRELKEETSYSGKVDLVKLFTFRSGEFTYQNYLALVPKEFTPKLDWETSRAGWYPWLDWPKPQHFGLTRLLQDKPSFNIIQDYLK